ncbi:hemerythrin domain-containing protein [Chitiniphilus eburneus]|uniref:Hemerythrin domain-containing protein n=1 Tax=Chitiniphilus eburneus TaxID=2571148 RepID=A0A4U0PB58_9NEIS|nr:hemerythrin domain-containing protein [Chitiniphilus eburneus]TJZ64730.1 hemerythrin domain-containing protein [Chitiniphilus eburneus]
MKTTSSSSKSSTKSPATPRKTTAKAASAAGKAASRSTPASSRSAGGARATQSRATARTRATTQRDALKSLKDDHAKVKKLFKAFESAKSKAEQQRIAAETCLELKIHTQIEEEVFYPAVRKALREEGVMLDEAEIEHASAKELIAQLEAGEAGSTRYEALYTVLSEYVLHHVKEEEKEMFPKVSQAKSLDLKALGARLDARREELKAELSAQPLRQVH